MTARKPNNLPWVILGGVCVLAILAVMGWFALALRSAGEKIAEGFAAGGPAASQHSPAKTQLMIYVNENNEISLGNETLLVGASFSDVSAFRAFSDVNRLKEALLEREQSELKSANIVLLRHEKSTPNAVVPLREMLDDLGIKSRTKIRASYTE